jgi:sarcosine oxidase subunit alpha
MSGRLPKQPGEWIDRGHPISFRFEGREYSGFAGDTISSALWANGVRILGRSFKYHRPRGVFSLSGADATAMMQWGERPNIRADETPIEEGMDLHAVNTRGGVDRDRLRILDRLDKLTPVGFYYKAFHTPRALFPLYEKQIRKMAGLGSIAGDQRHRHTPKDYAFRDVLVIGAGPAGLSAAAAAAEAGAEVMLVDSDPHPGGSLGYQGRYEHRRLERLSELVQAAKAFRRVELRTSTTAVGHFADNWIALVDGERLTKMRARSVVMATGAREQHAVFRNNDLPGVMLAGAARRLIHRFAVRPCSQAVVLTANENGYGAALDLLDAGVEVAAVIDLCPERPSSGLVDQIAAAGVPIRFGHCVYQTRPTRGQRGIQGVQVRPLDDIGNPRPDRSAEISCDGVLMSVGWAPADELLRQAGSRMEYDGTCHQFLPVELPTGVFAAGRVNGVYDLGDRIRDGRYAGQQAAGHLGLVASSPEKAPLRWGPCPNHPYPVVAHPKGKDFVDFDEDVQTKDIENSVQEGFDSPELLKRFSTVGMGPSQGKHSNLLSLRILARTRGEEMDGKAVTTARPYSNPVRLGHLAGRTFTALRRTPTHAFHTARNAKLMYAGNWLRPEYYPIEGKTREQCIEEEALCVRNRIGLIDLGTLGGIDLSGSDAAAFLGRIYCGAFMKLKVGGSRYSLMVDESGVVIDDGVICRLAEDRFYFTTTTTGSDAVYRKLLWWLVQWDMDVEVTNSTSHYGAMNLAGPLSREVLQPLIDTSLADEDFPYVAMREFKVAGVPSRVKRVGFVGELGYEIHSLTDGAMHVWERIMDAGARHGIRPFGVEAQRLLRLEKGHLIVGQDTDGLTDPYEAGAGWAVRMKKAFFVGQRSLSILKEKGRNRQLVGFTLAKGRRDPLPKECHLVVDGTKILGRVTSAKYSPTLDRVIGLAYVPPALSEPGSKINIKVDGGRIITATMATTPFYDPDNERQKMQPSEEVAT